MKKVLFFLMTLMLLCLSVAVNAQSPLTIGTGTDYSASGNSDNGQGSPMGNTYYYNSAAQFIYTAEELAEMGGAKAITSVAFYHNSYTLTNNIKIYLAHTAATTVDASNPATDPTLVYSGSSITIGGNVVGWQTFTLDEPFNYNGTDNLLVVVCRVNNSGTSAYNSNQAWQYTETTGNTYMVRHSDSSPYGDITNTTYSYTVSNKRPNIQIAYTDPVSCFKPTSLAVTLTPGNGSIATLNWAPGGNEANWVLEYGTASDFTGATSVNVSGTMSRNLEGLTAEIKYYARVKADCGGGDESEWSNPISFTPTDAYTLSLNEGSGTNYNVPIYYYYISNSSLNTASQFIIPASDLNSIQWANIEKLTFYANTATANYGNAEFTVYAGETAATTQTSFTDWNTLTEVYTGSVSVNNNMMEITFDNPFSYTTGNLLIGIKITTAGTNPSSFTWKGVSGLTSGVSLYSGYSSTPLTLSFLPQVTISYTPGVAPSCLPVSELATTLTPGDGTVATLTWTENGSASDWVLQYGTNQEFTVGSYTEVTTGFSVDGTTVTANLTSLTAEQTYYARVKADCGENGESDWSFVTNFTPTNAIIVNSGTESTNGYVPLATNYKCSYDQMIYTADQLAAAGITGPCSITKIGFKAAAANTVKRLPTLYMGNTDKSAFSDNTDFISINNLTTVYVREYSDNTTDPDLWTITAGWNEFELDEPFEYDGTSNLVIAMHCGQATYYNSTSFNHVATTGNQVVYAYNDNADPIPATYEGTWSTYSGTKEISTNLPVLRVYATPLTCPRPLTLTASDITTDEASLSWTENGSATAWQICINGDEEHLNTVTTNPYSLTSLTPGTNYSVKVRANCGENGYSEWSSDYNFITEATCTEPSALHVVNNSVEAHQAQISWTAGGEETTWDIYYSTSNIAPTSATAPIVNATPNNPYTITELTPNGTTYYVWVRAHCGDEEGQQSLWIGGISFATACDARTDFPISYGFETSEGFQTGVSYSSSAPTTNNLGNCWRNQATSSNGNNTSRLWCTATTHYDGSQSLMLPDKGSNGMYNTTLLAFPPMNFTSENGYKVSFWIYRNDSGSNPEGFKVYASLTDTIDASAVLLGHYSRNYGIAYPKIETASGWYQYEFYIPQATITGTVYLIFEGQSYYGNATYVDDITIEEAPSCYPVGTLAEATNITATSADLSWTLIDNNQTSWRVKYATNQDFQNEMIAGADANSNFTLVSLIPETHYWVGVYADCGGFYGELSNVIDFTTDIACAAPTDLTLVSSTTNSLTVSWTENGSASVWKVAYKAEGEESFHENTIVTENPYTIEGLTDGTNYTVRVISYCPNNYFSHELTGQFQTEASCPAPTNLAVTANSETAHGATITWDGNDVNDSYIIEYAEGPLTGLTTLLEEGFEGGSMPTGWTQSGNNWKVGSGSGNNSGVSTAATDDFNVNFYTQSSASPEYLITPAMNMDGITTATLSFNYVNPAWAGGIYSLTVYYRVNGGEWNQLESYTSAQSSWITKTIPLTGMSANYQIGFEASGYDNDYGYGIGLDDITITAEYTPTYTWNTLQSGVTGNSYTITTLDPETQYVVRVKGDCNGTPSPASNTVGFTTLEACGAPTAFILGDVEAHQASFSWTAGNGNEAWKVYVKKHSVAEYPTEYTSVTTAPSTENPVTINELDAATAYDVKIVPTCDENKFYEVENAFTTKCEAVTIPAEGWTEKFDSYTGVTSGATNNLPICWNYINGTNFSSVAGYPLVYNGSSDSYSGNNHLRFNANKNQDPHDQYAILPAMHDVNTLRINLYARLYHSSYGGTFTVGVMTDPADADSFVPVGEPITLSSTNYTNYTINLNSYNGSGNYIAIKLISSTTTSQAFFIDDITVELLPSCEVVSGLTVGEKTANSVALSWTPGSSQETNWKLQYRVDGYEEWNTINVSESDLNEGIYTLGQLSAETTYNWQVAAACSNTDISEYTAGTNFTTLENCPKPTNLTLTSGSETAHGATLTWTPGSTANEHYIVEYHVGGDNNWSTINNINEPTYTFTTLEPETYYEARVSAVCGTYMSDYCVDIVNFTTLEACPAPAAVTASNVTANAATISWNGTSDSYTVNYRTASSPTNTTIFSEGFETYADEAALEAVWSVIDLGDGANTNELGMTAVAKKTDENGFRFSSYSGSSSGSFDQYLISPELTSAGLLQFAYKSSSGTDDIFRVGYSTTNNNISDFTWGDVINSANSWKTFSQAMPEDAKYFAINYTAIYKYRLYIDDIVIYEMQPAGGWQTVNTTETSTTLTDLTPETTYEAKVQGHCANDDSGESELISFTPSCSFYQLLTDASDLAAGDKIIIAAATYDKAMSTTQNTSNHYRGITDIIKNGNRLGTPSSTVQVLTLEEGTTTGTWALNTGNGYLKATSSSSNYLDTQDDITDNASWTITVGESIASIVANGTYTNNTMRYNNSSTRISCYSPTNSQYDLAIYKLTDYRGKGPDTTHTGVVATMGDAYECMGQTFTASGDYEVLVGTSTNGCDSIRILHLTLMEQVKTPTFSPAEGEYNLAQNVEISCETADATIHYTTDGSTPTAASAVYSEAITVEAGTTVTIKAIAMKEGMGNSEVATATYTVTNQEHTITFNAGTGTCTTESMTAVSIEDLPTATLSETCTQQGWAFYGWSESSVANETTEAPVLVSTPYAPTDDITLFAVYSKGESQETEFNFASIATANSWTNGTQYSSVTIDPVTLTATGGGNDGKYYSSDNTWRIYSSSNGTVTITSAYGTVTAVSSNPSKEFTINNNGVASYTASANTNFKSITVTTGSSIYYSNPVCLETVATPTFNLAEGSYSGAQSVEISCATEDATIYYTLDGTEPSTSSTLYGGAIAITETATLKAIAVKENMNNSAVAIASYTIVPIYTVTLDAGNGSLNIPSNTVEGNSLNPIDLSNVTATLDNCDGWNFAGWSTSSVSETTTAPALVSNSYIPTNDITLYAVYQMGNSSTEESVVDLATGTFGNDAITWTLPNIVSFVQEQYTGSTAPNSSYISNPRWYSGNKITITPVVDIDSITVTATSTSYATVLNNSTYTNATTSISGSKVVIKPNTGSQVVTIVMGAQSRISSIAVSYSNGTTTYNSTPTCISSYDISATSADETQGTVSGMVGAEVFANGTYNAGTEITLTATANEGYTFVNWTKGGETVSYDATIMFTVTEDASYVANFNVNSYNITANVAPINGGDVTGAGSYDYGTTATLTATAATGYTFVNWTEGGEVVSTESTYGFNVTSARELVANFTANEYTITYMNGEEQFTTQTYFYNATVLAPQDNPTKTGYTFDGWIPALPETMPAQDITVNAQWTINTYNLTVTQVTGGTISVTVGNNSPVTESTTANYNALVALTAMPAANYLFSNWVVTSGETTIAVENNQFNMPAGDVTVTAVFTPMDVVATPTFTPVAGTYNDAQQVTINCTTEGASIYYTMDGSEPSTSSTLYNVAVTINETTTLKAIAVKQGMANSNVATALYRIVPKYNVVIADNIVNGTVNALPTSDTTGATITLTPYPATGYHFYSWHVTSGNDVIAVNNNSFVMPAGNVIVSAIFEPNSYNVTLNTNNGTINSGSIDSYTYGAGATLPNDVTLIGYTFDGWYDNAGFNGDPVNTISTTETGDKEFWAKWTVNDYTVTLNTNNGTINSGNVTSYTYGVGATLPTDVTLTGNTFGGWYDNAGFNGDPVATISTTETGNKEFWAKWTVNDYTVTLNTNNGTINSGNVTSYTYGVGATLPTDVTLTGYTFDGWYDNAGFNGDAVAAISTTETGNKEFWAKWTVNDYTVTLNTNNGTINSGNVTSYTYGVGATLPTDVTLTGYTFDGWYDNAGFNGDAVTEITATETDNKEFWAKWNINNYTVAASANPTNGGSIEGAGNYNHFANATLIATATTGYTFVNWTEGGQEVSTEATYSFQVTGERELVANFSLNTYAVSASANPAAGGTVTGAGTYDHGTNVTVTATANDGYAFVNWTEGGQEVSTNASYSFTFTEGRTLVANFTPIIYTVTFNPGTGSCQTQSLTGSIESSIDIDAVTAVPSTICGNQDWVFAGWSTASVGETSQAPAFVSGTEYVPTGNITLYAVYTKTEQGEGTWANATSIEVGDRLALVCNTKLKELSGFSGASTNYGTDASYAGSPAGAYPLTVVQGYNGSTYAFKTSDNTYLSWSTGNSLTTRSNVINESSWNVTFASGNATISNAKDNSRKLQYNSSSPRFACYSSGQTAVQLYKYTASSMTVYNTNPVCYVYAVNVDQNIEHGNVVADQTTDIVAGTEITLTPTPATGYHFGIWNVTAGNDPVTVENNKFTMPESDVIVSALFWIDTLTVNVNANPAAGGTVSGAGDYEYGDLVTLIATANTGYTFVNWTENNQEVSTDATYEFTFNGAAGTRTFVANFSLNSYEITVSANPTEGGNVNGGNTYNHGATANLTANPSTGYHFVNWTKDNVQVSTDAEYSFTVAEAGAYVANFALNSYTIAATANPTAGGAVSGAGTYNHFDNVTLTATVVNGYDFDGWYNGNDQVATSLEYSFVATGDVTLEARFAKRYTITFVPGSHSSSTIEPLQGSSVTAVNIDAVTADPSTLCVAQDWVFAGWSSQAIAETTVAPTTWVSGTAYYPTSDITLYAVYTKTEGAGSNTASIDFSDQGYTNAQDVTDVAISNNVNVTFSKGTSNNAPKYYSNNVAIPAIRCYGGNTFTVTATEASITNITLTFGTGDGNNYISPDDGDYSNGTWTGNANSVTFTIGGTSGNRRIAGMSVTTFSGTVTYNSDPECFVYDVVVNPNIEHGTVTADPNTGVIAGTEITLTNTPSEGYHFAGWNVAAGNDPVTVENNKFLMPESDVNVSATFEPDTFTLTVNYIVEGGGTAPEAYSARLPFGTPYSVVTPVIAGLTPSQDTVRGTIPAHNETVDVTYYTDVYTLTIHYMYANNTPAAEDAVRNLAYNVPYTVTSPTIEGYTPDQAVVSGTMGEDNVEVTVVYSINSHNLTINYVNEDASAQVAASHTATLNYYDNYSVTSPQVAGYAANKSVVSGTMGDADKTETVTYYQVQTNIVDATNCAGTGTGSLTVTAPTGNFEYSLDGVTFQTQTLFANLNAGDYTLYIRPTGEAYNYSGVWTVNSNITMPVAVASANPFYCLDNVINLSGNGSSTGSEYTYAWSGPNNFTATDINATIPEAGETHSGTYTLTVTNTVTNCVSDTTVDVIVNTPNMNGYLFTIATHGDAYANLVGGQATPVFATPTVQHYLADAGCTVNVNNDAQATYEEAGDYTITWTATDACGNTATTTQVLHIVLGTCPVAADVDGNTYPVVALNNICWMAANLRTTHYSDGRLIPNPMVYTSVMYPDATANLDMFGYLYDWTAAMDAANGLVQDANGNVQGICPDGWRMPKENEIRALVNDGVSDIFDLRTTDQWLNNFGTNTTGFSLLPAGCYNANSDRFENLHGDAYIWGVGASAPAQPRVFWADCKCYNWQILDTTTPMGYSVRCVRNN